VLASKYEKKEKKLTLYAAQADKNNGELMGEWTEITNWQKEEKGDDINFNITYNADSTKMVIVSTLEGIDKNNYEVREFDNKLNYKYLSDNNSKETDNLLTIFLFTHVMRIMFYFEYSVIFKVS
jgi:hypothetical protein